MITGYGVGLGIIVVVGVMVGTGVAVGVGVSVGVIVGIITDEIFFPLTSVGILLVWKNKIILPKDARIKNIINIFFQNIEQ